MNKVPSKEITREPRWSALGFSRFLVDVFDVALSRLDKV
jgi:hypothetical protein